MVRNVPKRLYQIPYVDPEGNEQIIEVTAYSAVQAEMAAQSEIRPGCSIIAVEETVRKDRRMCECFE